MQDKSYKTYVMGKYAVLFDREFLENLKSSMSIWWKMSWRYYSNWRILHIDGLEGCDADGIKSSGIPENLGSHVKYKFFTYAIEKNNAG